MRTLVDRLLGIVAVVALVTLVRPGAARPLRADMVATATLTGAEEVPDPGDPDGIGTANVTFKSDTGEVCWDIKVSNLTLPSLGSHIHEGAKGVAGPIVVPFSPPDANGVASGCTKPDAALVARIMQTPENFYVNVHTNDFKAGAIRGQLGMSASGAAPAPAPALMPDTAAGSGSLAALALAAVIVGAVGFGLRTVTRRRTTTRSAR
jgi:hypothetical protein